MAEATTPHAQGGWLEQVAPVGLGLHVSHGMGQWITLEDGVGDWLKTNVI